MRADPGSAHRDIAQHCIELGPAFPAVDRIDPYKHAIDGQELAADLVRDGLVVYRGLDIDAEGRELFEDAVKAIVVRSGGSPAFAIAAQENGDSIGFHIGVSPPGSLRRHEDALRLPTGRVTGKPRAGHRQQTAPLPRRFAVTTRSEKRGLDWGRPHTPHSSLGERRRTWTDAA